MTNQEIKTVGQTIAQETQIGGNTAARVGGVVEGIGVALDNKDAANGYYQATINGGTITVNAPNYLLGSGGNLRIKMPSAGTGASTLTIGNANAVQLWYNGAAVSSDNTWEADEIISVFYDGTRFMASNSQGGGGKFSTGEKVKNVGIDNVPTKNSNNLVKSDGLAYAKVGNSIDFSTLYAAPFFLYANKWRSSDDGSVFVKHIDVKPFESYRVVASDELKADLRFMSTYHPVANAAATWTTEFVNAGETVDITIPEGCYHLVFQDTHARTNGTTILPTAVYKLTDNGISPTLSKHTDEIDKLKETCYSYDTLAEYKNADAINAKKILKVNGSITNHNDFNTSNYLQIPENATHIIYKGIQQNYHDDSCGLVVTDSSYNVLWFNMKTSSADNPNDGIVELEGYADAAYIRFTPAKDKQCSILLVEEGSQVEKNNQSLKEHDDVLNGLNSMLELHDVDIYLTRKDADISAYNYINNAANNYTWANSANLSALMYRVYKGDTIIITGSSNKSRVALLSDTNIIVNKPATFVNGHEGFIDNEDGESKTINIEQDCYLYVFNITNSGIDKFPASIELQGKRYGVIEDVKHIDEKTENRPMVGAIYFDGWSNPSMIPNTHMRLGMYDWNGRKPLWGWFAHESRLCDEWLMSPYIEIPTAAVVTMELLNSCVLWSDESQIGIYVKQEGAFKWNEIQFTRPDADDMNFITSTIDLSSYIGKTIQIGFRLHVSRRQISPIWQLKELSIKADGVSFFTRNFMTQTDFLSSDEDYWSAQYFGYNGNSYNTYDTAFIDHEIELAVGAGIDYFNFCFYPLTDGDGIDVEEVETQVRHRSMYSFLRSSHKYKMRFCLWIINDGNRQITSLNQWKSVLKFIADNYMIDGQYLSINGKPVIFVYVKDEIFTNNFELIDEYVKEELGYEDGFIWIINTVNTNYATGQSGSNQEYPYSTLANNVNTSNNSLTGNIVPTVMVGWDRRPWYGKYFSDIDYTWKTTKQGAWFTRSDSDLPIFSKSINDALKLVDGKTQEFKSIILYAWNEVCEGGFLMPIGNDPSGKWIKTLKEALTNYTK